MIRVPFVRPKLEVSGELFLTSQEIKDLGLLQVSATKPRDVALEYLEKKEVAAAVIGRFYKGVFQSPDDADLVAVSYQVKSFRGRADTPIHVFVHRFRDVWMVLDQPGRSISVLPGPPPGEFKRIDPAP